MLILNNRADPMRRKSNAAQLAAAENLRSMGLGAAAEIIEARVEGRPVDVARMGRNLAAAPDDTAPTAPTAPTEPTAPTAPTAPTEPTAPTAPTNTAPAIPGVPGT